MTESPFQKIVREIPARVDYRQIAQVQTFLATYGRVSSDSEEQLNSYRAQKEHYEGLYLNKEGITYVGHYADEARSGKSIKRRDEFKRLIADCHAGKVNRIVTKSVSRFARNNVECMKIARELKNIGVTIYFETGGIDTVDDNAFIILSLLSVLAEEEIRTLSENIKWGYRAKWLAGEAPYGQRIMGYHVSKGEFTIIPSEALVVKQIIDGFMGGETYYKIAAMLNELGVKKPERKRKGKLVSGKWTSADIERILTNEKYCGDVYGQKTCSPDIMLERRINDGSVPKYEILNNHAGIISRETFKRVQLEIERRRIEQMNLTADRGKYSSKYAFSGKLECECGSKFRRYSQTYKTKSDEFNQEFVWVCIAHQKNKASCPMKPIKEKDIERAFVAAVNRLVAQKAKFQDVMQENIKAVVATKEATSAATLRQRLENAQVELIEASKNRQTDDVARLMDEIRSIQSDLEIARITDKEADIHLLKMNEALKLFSQALTNFNELVFRSQVQRVIVQSENSKPVALKFVLWGSEIVERLV